MSLVQPFDFFLQWHITDRCNLRCRHCYQRGTSKKEPTVAEAGEVAAEAAAMLRAWAKLYGVAFSPSCNVTGGEPFVRDDLFPLMEAVGREGFALFLLTNGTLVDRSRALSLAALGVQGVQVSFEGPQPVHDKIRGRGAFRAAAAGVRVLAEAGLPVTLNVTLSRLNAPYAPKMAAIARQMGATRLGFSRLVPTGRGRALWDQMLTPAEVASLYATLFAQEAPGLQIVSGDPVAAQMREPAPSATGGGPFGGCAAGVSGLTLLPDGTILPCRRLEIPLGNVRTDSLREVWASSAVLAGLRDQRRYRDQCGACARWSGCRGCRAIAFAVGGAGGNSDPFGPDPQCFLEG
jgi:radical SAM protein with 4Fe4S-binding SPASM domain